MTGSPRSQIQRSTQVEVFFRDSWLCHLCRRPTVFPLTFKLMEEYVGASLPDVPVAMFNDNWRRDKAPLLDELGACIDHVEAYARGGSHDASNFATACARCNARKSDRPKQEFLAESRPHVVHGKHGEPQDWDGLASLFVVLARQSRRRLTAAERDWLKAIKEHYSGGPVR